ncbi:MAG TPA: carboxypeptidase regulatory-like domain-containing protein [Blastocatellia bacterium]|nr:carboxypeptidase regulatory-like domain-containing protein [Blastocatellia bacterium]
MTRLSFAISILVLPFTFHSIQAQPGETKTGTATISGLVTLKGEPARAVEVILVTEPRWSANAPRARTDENGRFLFTNVAAGSYEIFAVAPGYVSPPEMHSVADGVKVENVDLKIKRGGVIAGRIRDPQGRPVIEEAITLKKLDKPQSYSSYSPNDGRTDDRGVYRIYGLPEGRYLVSVGYASPERSTSSRAFYPRVFYPNANSESEAKVIEVSEGSEATDVDITVPDPKETRDVSGRVVDADTGQPVEGVRIEVHWVSSDGLPMDRSGTSESGPNGAFRFFGLLPSKYTLFTQYRMNNGFVGDPVIFDVSESDASGIELKVRRGAASISGVVVIEGTSDQKALAKLSQVSLYATVILAAPKTGESIEMPPVQINADGSFRMDGLPAGKAGIWRWSRSDELTLARIERNGAPTSERIEIAAGEQVTGVRVVFLHGALTLRGEMKVVGGTLPADCRGYVIALRADQNAKYSQSAWSDTRGEFVIENLASGEYEITVSTRCPDPEIGERFPSVKKRVFVGGDNQQPVTFVVDLSQKGGDK